jgi:lipopolysaccharide export system protein LptA
MKTSLAISLGLTLAACGWLQAQAQAPPAPKPLEPPNPQGPPDYRSHFFLEKSNVLELLISGENRKPVADRDDLITPFQFRSFRNGREVQLIGRAPECHVDLAGHRAWDAGPIILFTPTTNVWTQGEGFLFIETNHLLTLSNKVETRVLKELLKTSPRNGPKTNAPETTGQVLQIFADGPAFFDYQSNFAQYFHHVHAIDPQLDLASEKLSIQMTTNSTVQTILAEENVKLTTTNKGYATGPRAFYYLTNGSAMTELTGGAFWHNGDEMARAATFIYDSTNRILTAIGEVRVWWPNGPQQPGLPPKLNEHGYRELWADFATLQWPPTNGPVEEMHARGHVLIVNQDGASRSMSERADYVRTNNMFELTGQPVWWNDEMKIHGRTLTAEATNQIYHARGHALMERKTGGPTHTNQWLYIASQDVDYQTNVAVFTNNVKLRLVEDNILRDTLTSDRLDVELFSNDVKTAVARGHVQGETVPDKMGRIKTIACDTLTAHNNTAAKMLTDIVAESHVVLRQFGTNATEPRSQLAAATATAYFSAVLTNHMERAVAEGGVIIDQVKSNQTIHATGERSVYTVAADEVVLTGAPVGRTDRQLITNADYMIWQPKTNRFRAYGPYTIIPIKTNQPPARAAAPGGLSLQPISSEP